MYNLVDTIARIKNAYKRGKLEVKVKNTKFIKGVLDCLIKEGYIRGYYEQAKYLNVLLKYRENKSVIHKLKMVSKPSLKVYLSFDKLKQSYFKGEYFVVTSSQGIFLNKECSYKEKGPGGLVLFEIN